MVDDRDGRVTVPVELCRSYSEPGRYSVEVEVSGYDDDYNETVAYDSTSFRYRSSGRSRPVWRRPQGPRGGLCTLRHSWICEAWLKSCHGRAFTTHGAAAQHPGATGTTSSTSVQHWRAPRADLVPAQRPGTSRTRRAQVFERAGRFPWVVGGVAETERRRAYNNRVVSLQARIQGSWFNIDKSRTRTPAVSPGSSSPMATSGVSASTAMHPRVPTTRPPSRPGTVGSRHAREPWTSRRWQTSSFAEPWAAHANGR